MPKNQRVESRLDFPISRRRLLLAGTGLVLTTAVSAAPTTRAFAGREFRIAAVSGRAALKGEGRPETDVWGYDGKVPGPTLRVRQGEAVRIVVENRLDQDTTVHWHHVRLPNAMDGVPGLTQPPIKPGESFVYESSPRQTPAPSGITRTPTACSSSDGARRGLHRRRAGADRRRSRRGLGDDGLGLGRSGIVTGFGNAMEAAMFGRVGNTVTLNGSVSTGQSVRAGERIGLRLINGALARIMRAPLCRPPADGRGGRRPALLIRTSLTTVSCCSARPCAST